MATNTTTTSTSHTGNTTAGPFAISFTYVKNTDIDVTVAGVLKTLGTHYTFTSATQITFTSGNEPANGAAIVFRRNTNVSTKAVDFQDGSVLTETDLDTSTDQLINGIQEIADDYVKRDGTQTITGNLVFEGATDDANETTLAITDPTADRTITLPDTTGTVVTTGDTGTVSSTMITNGTIVDADINASAAIAGSKLQAASGSNAGSMSASDKTKLDGIEASATADQTAAEIRTLVENATDSNVFTDADHTKLDGIETSATADQTAAEIRTLVESATDSNVFTDADHSKLNGIEANATADQTDAEIRAAVEAASDSNVFTDADHSKLNGIEASADVTDATNVDAAGAVMNTDLATKGQILVGDGTGDPTALSVGQNNYVLVADSNEATGVKWATVPAGSGLSNVVEDTTPQLGGNLDVQASEINTSTTNGNIKLNPNGTGVVEVKGDGSSSDGTIQLNCSQNSHGVKIKSPAHSAGASYTLTLPSTIVNSAFLQTDSNGNLSFTAVNTDLVNDTTPQLGGDLQSNGNDIDFADNDKAIFGTGGDMEIFTDGTNSFIKNTTGNLRIQDTNGNIQIQAKAGEESIVAKTDGAVELYFDNSKKAETVTGGFAVTGDMTISDISPSITFADTNDDPDFSIFANSGQLKFKDDTNDIVRLRIDANGQINIVNNLNVGGSIIGDLTIDTDTLHVDSTNNRVGIGTTSPSTKFEVQTATGERVQFLSNGSSQQPRIDLIRDSGTDFSIINAIGQYQLKKGSNKIYEYASDTHRFSIDGTEKVRIDSSGRLLIGTSTSRSPGAVTPQLQIEGTNSFTSSASITRNSNDGGSGSFIFNKSRGTSVGSDTIVQSGDYLGIIQFVGNDGTDSDSAAAWIVGRVDGTPGSNDMPGRLEFYTTADGAASPTERMRIDSSGSVGIGIASPARGPLHVHNNSTSDCQIHLTNDDTGATSQDGLTIFTDTDTAGIWSRENVDFQMATNNTERMRIDSSGRLLIGTTSGTSHAISSSNNPSLQVESASSANYGRGSFVYNGNNGVGPGIYFGKSRGTAVGSNTAVADGDQVGGLFFQAADGSDKASRAASIVVNIDGTPGSNDTPGRITFSTTKDGNSSPSERMAILSKGRIISLVDDTDSVGVLHKRHQSSNSHNFFEIRSSGTSLLSGGTLQFAIETDGDVKNTNNSYSSLSDIKLKENIVDAKSQWNDIKALKIRNYNFKSELDYGTYTQIGLIAQEVEETSPGLVVDNIDRDDEGKDLGTVTKTLRYSVLHIKALKALQEAMAKIEVLETKVAALESA
tara:strand:- start:850 stop:4704 length:3855 start_codon:yes stop_codon:yes gene_type:complete